METIVIDATRTGAFRVGNMIFPVNSLKMRVEPKKDADDGDAAISFYNVVTGELEAKVKRNQVVMADGNRPFRDTESGDYFDPLDGLPTMVSQMFAVVVAGSGGGSGDAPTREEFDTLSSTVYGSNSRLNELEGWKMGAENTVNWLANDKIPEIEGRLTALEG